MATNAGLCKVLAFGYPMELIAVGHVSQKIGPRACYSRRRQWPPSASACVDPSVPISLAETLQRIKREETKEPISKKG